MKAHTTFTAPDRGWIEAPGAGPALHIAVVHGPEEVYLVAAASSREAVLRELCRQLAEEAHMQLWEEDAARFRALMERRGPDEAVDFYFSRVGQRWDPARLSLHVVPQAR
jgi:hypothetical protein